MVAGTIAFSSREFLGLIETHGLVGNWGWTFATNEHVWSIGLWHLLGLESGNCRPNYRTFRDFIHPDDRDKVETEAQILVGEIQREQTFRIVRPDGEIRVMSSCKEVYCTTSGRLRAVAGVLVDITDGHTIAITNAIERRRHRALFNKHKIVNFTISEHLEFVFPEEASELAGISLSELITNPFAPCAKEETEHWTEVTMTHIAQGAGHNVTPMTVLADGSRRRFSIAAVPIRNMDNAIEEWCGMLRPIEIVGRVTSDSMRRGLEQAVAGRYLRAGRALLDWSMTDLAGASGLSLSTIRRLEGDEEQAASHSRHRAIAALRSAGVNFTYTEQATISLTLT